MINREERSTFTVIELVVLIAIIALLIGILMPGLQSLGEILNIY